VSSKIILQAGPTCPEVMSITVDMNKLNLNPASRGDSEASSSSDEDDEKGNSSYKSFISVADIDPA
jgi:hypothetical protein